MSANIYLQFLQRWESSRFCRIKDCEILDTIVTFLYVQMWAPGLHLMCCVCQQQLGLHHSILSKHWLNHIPITQWSLDHKAITQSSIRHRLHPSPPSHQCQRISANCLPVDPWSLSPSSRITRRYLSLRQKAFLNHHHDDIDADVVWIEPCYIFVVCWQIWPISAAPSNSCQFRGGRNICLGPPQAKCDILMVSQNYDNWVQICQWNNKQGDWQ